jgi:hypothetical protein
LTSFIASIGLVRTAIRRNGIGDGLQMVGARSL